MTYSRLLKTPTSSLLCIAAFLAGCQTTQEITPAQNKVEEIAVSTLAQVPPTQALATSEPLPDAQQPVIIDDLWERLRQGFQLQQYYDHPAVQPYIENYASNQRLFDLVVERASPFLYFIIEEAESRNLPLELTLLPIVESTFNPNASSSERAVGLWQFMAPTARSFGVQQDWWYDGRRDPLVSTNAALEYLSQLHQQFSEDWLVAMAAYNTGDGNVRRAMRRGNQALESLDFWELPLAPETRSHVPKLLAIAAVVSRTVGSELDLERIPNQPQLVKVQLDKQIDLAQAATLAGVDTNLIRALNPGYLQWATHPDAPQSILVPRINADDFIKSIAQSDPSEFMTWDRYEIKAGDTLGQIARGLETRVDILQAVNGISGSKIVAGDSLLIPRNIDSLSQLPRATDSDSLAQRQRQFPNLETPENYRVKSGDNLWSIARRFNLKSAEIAERNNIALNALLRPGQILQLASGNSLANGISAGTGSVYSVQTGDSIALIAQRFDHRISELLLWNSLNESEIIYPGQLIRLTPPESGTN